MPAFNPLDYRAPFIIPHPLTASDWLCHAPFGLFIMELLRPKQLLEINEQPGEPYAILCQAVEELALNTICYSLSTSVSANQTTVPASVKDNIDNRFSAFSQTIYQRPESVTEAIPGGAIDLVHFNRALPYDDLAEMWHKLQPRLAPNAVVLINAINAPHQSGGMQRFWQEQSAQQRSFSFITGQGVGLFAIGDDEASPIVQWLEAANGSPLAIRRFFSQLGERLLLQQQHEELRAIANVQEQELQTRRSQPSIETLRAQFEYERAALAARLELFRTEREYERTRSKRLMDDHLASLAEAHERAMAKLADAHEQLKADLHEQTERRIDILRRAHADEQRTLRDEFARQLAEQRAATDAEARVTHEALAAAWQSRALAAESAYTALRNTRGVRVVSGWWGAKRFAQHTVATSGTRYRWLVKESVHIWNTEGSRALAIRMGRWLGGERRHYNRQAVIEPPANQLALQAPGQASDSGQLIALRSQPVRSQATIDIPAGGGDEEAARSLNTAGKARLAAFLATNQRLAFPVHPSPTVSIVIPVHNQAHHTYMLLENLLATTSGHAIEIVIGDDASTDDTAQLLKSVEHIVVCRNEQNVGFGETCNLAAAKAKGKYICFLNNDTLPLPGWLDALLAIAESHPQCGAVGAKIIFADHRLQEAGCIVWRDGFALGYGRGQDAFKPEFGYVREVDFCSAACLLVRADIFQQVGGFDRRYAPAYYEDVDLCFAIREAGYTIFFAPNAVIVHLEHATSGRESAVALQLRNRETFVRRWEAQLAQHQLLSPKAILRERDSRRGKRLLILDDIVPLRQLGSGFPRTLALLDTVTTMDYVVTYLPTTDPRPYEPMTTELQQLGVEVLYNVTDIASTLQERPNLYDIVIISRPHNAPLIDVARAANPRALIIYDAEALFTLREARQASTAGQPLATEELATRLEAELRPMAAADLLLTVSEVERRAIMNHAPQIPIEIWGHALATQIPETPFAARTSICFVGYLASEPNDDALRHFFADIYPRVLEAIDCDVVIAGVGATPEVQRLAARYGARVTWLGFVDDLRDLFEQAKVFVAPHRFAAGIPIKVIEAMAYGVPCVISQLLAEQLGVKDGTEALAAADPDALSAHIVEMFTSEPRWTEVQRAALSFVEAHYGPAQMREKLASILEYTPGTALSPSTYPGKV